MVQKGVSLCMPKNEFLFKLPVTNTCFQAFFSKMECVLPLNGVHFGAKCNAFRYKMECVLVLNAMRFAAKRKVKCCKTQCDLLLNARKSAAKCEPISINIRCNGINKTF